MLCTDVSDSTVSKTKASSSHVGRSKPPPSSQPKGYSGSSQRKKRSDSDFYSSLAVQGSEDDSDGEAVRDCLIMCLCVWLCHVHVCVCVVFVRVCACAVCVCMCVQLRVLPPQAISI